jgi:hypothetical protein
MFDVEFTSTSIIAPFVLFFSKSNILTSINIESLLIFNFQFSTVAAGLFLHAPVTGIGCAAIQSVIDISNSTIIVDPDTFLGGSADAGIGYTTTPSNN